VSAIYKMSLAIRALGSDCETPISDDDVSELAESDLPTYTVLLPLYKEGQMLHGLIAAVESIDYPKYKLDVKLLMEEDDLETQEAADRESLPDYFQKLVVQRGRHRGKPRACNYGLLYAKGAFCVIF